MRLDKYLQVSRIIKRRAVAKEIVAKNRVKVNDNIAKPSTKLKIDDIMEIGFGDMKLIIKVLELNDKTKKEDAYKMYEIIEKVEE
ncbi:MAG: RNA-binding S4 domain-containing protein [Erysipelotrichales bacterium]